jgi:hypothetical protein
MRKRIIGQDLGKVAATEPNWIDLEPLAQVEVTSEDAGYPIESVLIPGMGSGWRAAQSGEQIIRLLFDEPLKIKLIRFVFYEDEHERTQEFVLRWLPDGAQSYREIVRQQYNFSPPETLREVEDYDLDLDGVKALELRIMPDISSGSARASLEQLRLA